MASQVAANARKRLAWEQAGRRAATELGLLFREVRGPEEGDFGLQIQAHSGPMTLEYRTTAAAYPVLLRAEYFNRRRIHFELYPAREDVPAQADHLTVGDPLIDGRYALTTASPVAVTAVFSEVAIRRLLSSLPAESLSIRTKELPTKFDELYSPLNWAFADAEPLRTLIELFEELSRGLVGRSKPHGDVVLRHIQKLQRSHEGSARRSSSFARDAGRAHAAQQLGLVGDRRGLDALIGALDDPSKSVQIVAVRALGRLGDPGAVPALLPLLRAKEDDLDLRARVARDSLGRLGAGSLVSTFDDALDGALRGEAGWLGAIAGANRAPFVQALLRSLTNPRRRAFANAYQALADLNEVECLPILEEKLAEVTLPAIRLDCEMAIARLKSLQTLPRLAGAPVEDAATLPRQAEPDLPDARGFPRPSSATDVPEASRGAS